jgi:pyruvate dehydrogenase E2 component (dihydrolipoamide acetyltransferase)
MAQYEFRLPELGEGVVEGEIVQWLVKPGDVVAEDQSVVEVMTDKATVSVPTPKAGKVLKTFGAVGDLAKVHELLVLLETDVGAGEEAASTSAPAASAAEGGAPAAAPAAATPAAVAAAAPAAAAPVAEGGNGIERAGRRILATPVTRRMAAQHGVDLATVAGSGPQGRVTKDDVLRHVEAAAAAVNTVVGAPAPAPAVAEAAADTRLPVRGLRRKIAENLVRSKHSAPHYHFVEEVDVTRLVAVRDEVNAKLAASGEKLSFLPFLVKAVIAALRKNPRCNAVMDEAANELVLRGEYNIGIAVATDDGLVVPVIRNADRLTMREIAREIARLSEAARGRRLAQADVGGGTFTITSLGAMGGLLATPILNHPEVAIMGVHRMQQRPVVAADGSIVVRDMMNLSFGFDHRNVDGAEGARFAYDVIAYVAEPSLLLAELR